MAEADRPDSLEALRRERERLEFALTGSQLALWDADLAAMRVLLSPHWKHMLGEPAEVSVLTLADLAALVPAPDLEQIRQGYLRAVKGEAPEYRVVHRVRRADGTWMWIESHGKVFERSPEGRALRMVGTNMDVTEREIAKQELAAQERELRTVSDNMPALLALYDPEMRYLYVNRRFCTFYGVEAEAILGRSLGDVFGPAAREEVLPHFNRALAGERTEYERVIHRDGKRRRLEVLLVPARDEAGKVMGCYALATDITHREAAERALRESEERFRGLVELSTDWYWEQDEHFRFTRVEGVPAGRYVGNPARLLGKTRWEQGHSNVTPEQWAEHKALLERHEPFKDFLAIIQDERGEVVSARLISGRPVFDQNGRFTGYRGIGHEVTERVRAERALVRARAQAEAANRAKGEYLAMMSHEIRTPINGVIGLGQLLLDTPLNAQQRGYVQTIVRSGQGLVQVLSDVLDYAKIEAGKIDLVPAELDLAAVVDETVALLAMAAADKGLDLIVHYAADCPRYVVGDAGRIQQVLSNLVSNAIKFTERGDVSVRVESTSEHWGSARLRIEVRDTGIGIEPEAVQGLFQPYAQAGASTARRYGGTGLGLSICRRLIDAMGGTIDLESRPGTGSTFRVELTLPRTNPPESDRPAALAGVWLLVVDEHALSRAALAERARALGLRVEGAGSEEEALARAATARARSAPFRVALLVQRQGRLDAAGLARRLPPELRSVIAAARPGRDPAAPRSALALPLSAAQLGASLLDAVGRAASVEHAAALPTRLRGTVLLAEDHEVNRQVAAAFLRKLGVEVVVAVNGLEAVQAATRGGVDLVLMDFQMPVMDGVEAARRIRESEAGTGAHLPIVAMTASMIDDARRVSADIGIDDFIPKPFVLADLSAKLSRWLATAHTS